MPPSVTTFSMISVHLPMSRTLTRCAHTKCLICYSLNLRTVLAICMPPYCTSSQYTNTVYTAFAAFTHASPTITSFTRLELLTLEPHSPFALSGIVNQSRASQALAEDEWRHNGLQANSMSAARSTRRCARLACRAAPITAFIVQNPLKAGAR